MSKEYDKLIKCYESVKAKIDFKPEVGVVLGSGLGHYAKKIEVKAKIPYSEIEGFPVSTIAGHKGQFVFGYVEDVPVVLMEGRVHYYEGYEMSDVVLPIRLMHMLGVQVLILTNAAGGVNKNFEVGDFMLIRDHISSFIPSPLIGKNMDKLGPRFPDMSKVYDVKLRDIICQASCEIVMNLKEGVYVQFTGPAYETPAEIQMSRLLGADAVGMSTVCEAIAAHHAGMRVCGISCITNMAAGVLNQPLSHEEVTMTGDRIAPLFRQLLRASIIAIHKSL